MKQDKAVNMLMSSDLHMELKKKARTLNVSIASVIRMACVEYLRKEER